MEGFKIICNHCGEESTIQQDGDNVDIKGKIEIEYWEREYNTNKISFTCKCGNEIHDK